MREREFKKEKPSFKGKDKDNERFKKNSSDKAWVNREKKEDKDRKSAPKRSFDKKTDDEKKSSFGNKFRKSEDRPFRDGKKPFVKKKDGFNTKEDENKEKKSYGKNERRPYKRDDSKHEDKRRPFKRRDERFSDENSDSKRNFSERDAYKSRNHDQQSSVNEQTTTFQRRRKRVGEKREQNANDRDLIRLNRFISNGGYCSRRKADELIEAGAVRVNGSIISELGYKVHPSDKVEIGGVIIQSEALQYVLLNKPKDYITTSKDPMNRKTVMELIADACKETIYPVGRLDRNTTGLLLFTNDGIMAKKLMHPSSRIKKVYQATLDKNLKSSDLQEISKGVELDDGFVDVDMISFIEGESKNVVGIELHSGKYHVVKRIFEKFGYQVTKLDRTLLGPLTKRNLPRGFWRFLTDDEINILKRI